MRYLFLILTFAFTTELEVDGNLKVNGNIDANNNPITNVGSPLTMSDAINGNVLQDALRDDGVYEYKMYLTRIGVVFNEKDILWDELIGGSSSSTESWNNWFHTELATILNEGWEIDNTIDLTTNCGGGNLDYSQNKKLWIFKKSIED